MHWKTRPCARGPSLHAEAAHKSGTARPRQTPPIRILVLRRGQAQLRARPEVFSQASPGFNGGAGHGSTTPINDSANNALSAVQLDMKRLGCWLNLGSRYVGEEPHCVRHQP